MHNQFLKSTSGVIHLVDANNSEFTLCGDAWDIGSEEGMENLDYCSTGTVNCRRCADVILSCRGVRIAKSLVSPDAPTETKPEGDPDHV